MKTAKRKKEWFDDDSFWRELYPFMFPEKRVADADEQVAKALALTKPHSQKRDSGSLASTRRRIC